MNLYNYCLTSTDFKTVNGVYGNSIMYLAGVTEAFKFQALIKDDTGAHGISGKDFRLSLLDHAYFIVKIKYAALAYGVMPVEKARAYIGKFIGDEAVTFHGCVTGQKLVTRIKKYCKEQGIDKKLFEDSYANLAAKFGSFVPSLNRHIAAKVSHKLTFVSKSQQFEKRDLQNDLMCRALQAYRMLMPTTKSDQFILNYLRRACTNYALNIIETYTAKKSARIFKTGTDDFGNVYGGVLVDASYISGEDGLNVLESFPAPDESDSFNVEHMISRYTGWRKRALTILCGLSRGFSMYLFNIGRIKENQDSVDYMNRVGTKTFLKVVSKYCLVSMEVFERFVAEVGVKLKQGVAA